MTEKVATQTKLTLATDNSSTTSQKPVDALKGRESQELILGFAGPIGSGVDLVVNDAKIVLEKNGYSVEVIKLSKILNELIKNNTIPEAAISKDPDSNAVANRYQKLQNAGNHLREEFKGDVLAEIAISSILTKRMKANPDAENPLDAHPKKCAYLIDQLKHQDEVTLLRRVYGNLFFLVGVFCSEPQRKKNLTSAKKMGAASAIRLMERDRKDDLGHGQQLEKTLKLADLFIRNTNFQSDNVQFQVDRFINLIHGQNGITPSQHEYGMYAAYSAGLKSACLSRQVGASITDKEGNIIATGCNDVPKAGGGLYSERDGKSDFRCVKIEGGKCFNDDYKDGIKDKITHILESQINELKKENDKIKIPANLAETLSTKIKEESGLRDILEFSRSVHAEMDAITSVARLGGNPTQGGILYTTTYPCHNCARHIIAAGISQVYYIEPYEKSLAEELHDDAIQHSESLSTSDEMHTKLKKVDFAHFEGISPRQYQNLFYPTRERKNKKGAAIFISPNNEPKSIIHILDDYRVLETKVYEYLNERGIKLATIIE